MNLRLPSRSGHYVGLMSGTSLDGVDGVLAHFDETRNGGPVTVAHCHLPFEADLRQALLALQASGPDEIHREALAANTLAHIYAECIGKLLVQARMSPQTVQAAGVHGQTIRHQPGMGYTRQTNNPALIAELCGIDVIADFRSRDVAAGGQGAPLVPAFHQTVFASPSECRVVVNIGGIANISVLAPGTSQPVGFDTGPGNVLMDGWISRHLGKTYDDAGRWAAGGAVEQALLKTLLAEPYLQLPPPKSTGRDLFHMAWLDASLRAFAQLPPQNVQRTLCEFTAITISQSIAAAAPQARTVWVCGGGANNAFLMGLLASTLRAMGLCDRVHSTADLGIAPEAVESLAFAWLARQFDLGLPGNLPSVTGAAGPRVLGALYPR